MSAGRKGSRNTDGPVSDDWESVRAWRQIQRERLLVQRRLLSARQRSQTSQRVMENLRQHGPSLERTQLGFYWPLHGEIDLRPLIRGLLSRGAKPALPVIINNDQPLEFWQWNPQQRLYNRGLWGIPAPEERQLVQPTILLVPLLGFDLSGYRLGHGGGYYDRTLATIDPMPLTIGIGYQFSSLDTIYPQPHDMPLDAIITESGKASIKPR